MALPGVAIFPSTPKFQIKFIKSQQCQLPWSMPLHVRHRISPPRSMKITKAQLDEPSRVKLQLSVVKNRLWEAIPSPIKEFPWEQAEVVMLKRLLLIGQKAVEWSLITLFVLSSLSDVIFSVSKNQELIISIGLLVGCLLTDLFKEISLQMFQNHEEKGLNLALAGISCFFVLVKFISTYFAIPTQVFLLHVGNGGLLQAWWLCRKF